MSDDLIQAALKECGLDFTELTDDKIPTKINLRSTNNTTQIAASNMNSFVINMSEAKNHASTTVLKGSQSTAPFPIIIKAPIKQLGSLNQIKNQSTLFPTKLQSTSDLEKHTQTVILQKPTPSSVQLKNLKNIKIINLQKPTLAVVSKPKTSTVDLTDKKIVKVVLKPSISTVPLNISTASPLNIPHTVSAINVINKNISSISSFRQGSDYGLIQHTTQKPSSPIVQLKTLDPKVLTKAVYQKGSNVSMSISTNIPTIITPNLSNIKLVPKSSVISSSEVFINTPTLPSTSTLPTTQPPLTTTNESNPLLELRAQVNSPVVKFMLGCNDDETEDQTKSKDTMDDNKDISMEDNKDIIVDNVGDGTKEEKGEEDEESKVKDDGTCDFLSALQELNEANKKVEEIEAKIKEEKEEEEREKRIKRLLGEKDDCEDKSPIKNASNVIDKTESVEKLMVGDDDDQSNNTNNNLYTSNGVQEPTNILEFGRLFNNRYLPQNTTNKYNNVIFNNNNLTHSNSASFFNKNNIFLNSNNTSNAHITSNSNTLGGISLLKSGFNFSRNYSILRPSDNVIVTSNLHPIVKSEEDLEEEEMGHAETFADYMPTKLKIGLKHPDAVVESASLSSVEAPDVDYQLAIPVECIEDGMLSAVQLETVTYACQKHQNELPNGDRVGFLIGDGAGVGKGRTIAGIIYENFLRGRRRSLWLSVSSDLKVDAERDLGDIGASMIPVYSLNKFKYTKISSKINGKVKKGVIFSTYSALIGESKANNKYRTRLKQLTHWLGKEFDGLIIFDECHRAKNLFPNGSSKPTKTGRTVVELQRRLPKSRVVYASATGASEPRNMAYMVRLGLWGPGTPFKEFADFIHAVEKRGVGTMEMVAMEMKQRGTYIARQLSFKGVSFKVQEAQLSRDYMHMYNQAVKLWVDAREKFQQATRLLELDKHQLKVIWSQFWSSHQRFFKYLCISGKVQHCVALAKKAISDGKCVVIGLQSTGESRILDVVEEQGDELTDFVSSAKGVFQKLVETHFPQGDATSYASVKRKMPAAESKVSRKKFKKSESSSDEESVKNTGEGSEGESEDSSGDDDDDNDNNDEEEDEDEDEDEEDNENSSSECESDTNPFAHGSDSDGDVPWIRKKKPKPEKKEKKKKKVKKTKKESDDDDSELEYDKDVNKILEVLKKKETLINNNKASSKFTPTSTSTTPSSDNNALVAEMKRELLQQIDVLGNVLPSNTLDELIDLFGGPSKVAEMTGRKGRVVCGDDGSIRYEKRSADDVSLEILNLTEKQRFMDGEKHVAIISEAASSGISLQADRRALNQRRRVHITLELPWSADRAIQQFGRTHRSNQVSAPEYIFLISDLAGERRFASTVSKRLESLGALTHGDRRAAEARDLSQFNIDNKFGQAALEAVMKSVIGDKPLVTPPLQQSPHFFQDVRESLVGVGMVYQNKFGYSLDKESYNISKFLNRILGIEVSTQNLLFDYFTCTLKHVMLEAKRNGKWDMGILDLGSLGEKVMKLSSQDFHGFFSGSRTKITLNKVSVERGLSWRDAEKIYHSLDGENEGFYVSKQTYVKNRRMYVLVQMTRKHKDTSYKIFRANTGLQTKLWSLNELRQKYKKVEDEKGVMEAWQEQFKLSETQCLHYYQHAKCHNATACEIGRRCRIYHILCGSVLSFWASVERVLSSFSGQSSKMQIVRARMKDEKRIVGILINSNVIKPLIQLLKTGHLDDVPGPFNTSQHFGEQQNMLPQQKIFSPLYLQQQQQHLKQQQQIVHRQQLKQHQQLQQKLQRQQSILDRFNHSEDSPQTPLKTPNSQPPRKSRFVYSLSSSSLQQLNVNNININNTNIKYVINNNEVGGMNNVIAVKTPNHSVTSIKSLSNINNNNSGCIVMNDNNYNVIPNNNVLTHNNTFSINNTLANNNKNNIDNINNNLPLKKMPTFTIVSATSLTKPP